MIYIIDNLLNNYNFLFVSTLLLLILIYFFICLIFYRIYVFIHMRDSIQSYPIPARVCIFNFKLLAILMATLIHQSRENLICNGDFENYPLTQSYTSSDLSYYIDSFPNNQSCWYTTTPGITKFQVKAAKNPYLNITKAADLVGSQRYTLCQNISLEINATYHLSYQIRPDFSIASCNISLSIFGSVQHIGFYLSSSTSYQENLRFNASKPSSEICFYPKSIIYKSGFNDSTLGPLLDNVNLSFFSRPIKTVQINFALTFDPINNQMTLQSDFCFECLSQYSLPINYFSSIQIKIEDNEENGFVVSVDSQNFLKVTVNLKLQYDLQNFKNIELAIPNATYLRFVCFIDGRPTNLSSSSDNTQFIKAILPGAKFVGQTIRDVFNMFNTFAFSYFIVNLISFYNITLLYYFLHLKTLPGFVRSFFLSLAYIFFKRGSILDQVQRFGWIPSDFQFDFSTLNIIQKMDLYKNGSDLWFAYYGIYTNFAQANIQPLILLSFLLFKFCILKLITYPFPMLRQKMSLKLSSFFRNFSIELSYFTPFLIISAASTMKNVNQICFIGKLNSIVQIFVIFSIFLVPLLSFLHQIRKIQKIKDALRKDENCISHKKLKKKIKANSFEVMEAFLSSAMSFYIPFFILIKSPPIFFTFTTPLILKKIIVSIDHRKVFSCYKSLLRFFTTLAWATHHFAFMGLYAVELIMQFNQSISHQTIDDIRTLLGYAIICSILMGGLSDILKSLVELVQLIFIILKKARTLLGRNVVVPQKEAEKKIKKEKNYLRFKVSVKKVKSSKNLDTNKKINVTVISFKPEQQQSKNIQNLDYSCKAKSNNKHADDKIVVKFNDHIQQISLNQKLKKNTMKKSKCKKNK